MIKTVIISQENQSRKILRMMLNNSCNLAIVIGEASDVKSGINLLYQKKPDLILIDLEMSDGDAFDVLNTFENIKFSTIFLTKINQRMIKAIEYAGLDYLLKPINLEKLLSLLRNKYDRKNQLQKGSLQQTIQKQRYIILPDREKHIIVKHNNIVHMDAKGSYVLISLENGNSHLVANTLSYYEDLLPSNIFFRIHKSHLVNINKIKSFAFGRSGRVILQNGSELNIAARRKSAFNQFIKQQGKVQEKRVR